MVEWLVNREGTSGLLGGIPKEGPNKGRRRLLHPARLLEGLSEIGGDFGPDLGLAPTDRSGVGSDFPEQPQ